MSTKQHMRAPELSSTEKLKLFSKAEKIIKDRNEKKRYNNTCIEAGFCPRCGNTEVMLSEGVTGVNEVPICGRCSQWLEKIV